MSLRSPETSVTLRISTWRKKPRGLNFSKTLLKTRHTSQVSFNNPHNPHSFKYNNTFNSITQNINVNCYNSRQPSQLYQKLVSMTFVLSGHLCLFRISTDPSRRKDSFLCRLRNRSDLRDLKHKNLYIWKSCIT